METSDLNGEQVNIQRLLADAVIYKSPFKDIVTIIKNGGDLNKPVVKGLCALHYAVYDNDTKYASELIRLGALVDVVDDVGYTPLHICAKHGHYECMELLLKHGASVDLCSGVHGEHKPLELYGYLTIEPLNLAIENNKVTCAKLLLENGARPDNKYFLGYEINLVPLENHKCLQLLLEHGADPNVFSRAGINPLMKACKEQNVDAIELLVACGSDVNISNDPRFDEKTPLYFAIMGGNCEIVGLLLRSGANVKSPVCHKTYPLTLAVSRDRLLVSKLLIQHGADVTETNTDGQTPLMTACTTPSLKHQYELIVLLLKNGADPNSHLNHVSHSCPSLCPLVEYCVYNDAINIEVVHALIKYGARVSLCEATRTYKIKNPYGITGHVYKFAKYAELFNLVLDAVEKFEIVNIKLSNLTLDKQQRLLQMATTPMTLRRIVRFRVRSLLRPVVPCRVRRLPLPALLKSYLLFEANIESASQQSDSGDDSGD